MPTRPNAFGRRFAVATGHPASTAAAADILQAGGNAVDAAAAAALTLAVAHPDLVTFFGVAAIMVGSAQTRDTATVAGLGGWPRRATLNYFMSVHDGTIPEGLARTVVPGAPGAWLTALQRFGTMGFAEVAAPAIDLAKHGCPITDHVAHSFVQYAHAIAAMPTSARVYFRDGRPPRLGELMILDELAGTLEYLASVERAARANGRDAGLAAVCNAIYRGDVAATIASYHAANGGLLDREDLAAFVAPIEPALIAFLGDIRIDVCGPWCQSPLVAQIATLHDHPSLWPANPDSEAFVHAFIELTKLAMADRTAYFGDPAVVNVPIAGMLESAYVTERRRLMREDAAPDMPPPGSPWEDGARAPPRSWPAPQGDAPARANTAGIAVADADGNVCTATVSDVAVDTPVIPGLGCPVSSRGSQGWLTADHPGVVGPGRRPWLTACPVIVHFPHGASYAIASAGGDVQPQAIFQTLARMSLGTDPQSAIDAPRAECRSFPDSFWPHGYEPGLVRIESSLVHARDGLRRRGHSVEIVRDHDPRLGAVVLAGIDRSGVRVAAADSRRDAVASAR